MIDAELHPDEFNAPSFLTHEKRVNDWCLAPSTHLPRIFLLDWALGIDAIAIPLRQGEIALGKSVEDEGQTGEPAANEVLLTSPISLGVRQPPADTGHVVSEPS